MILVPKHLRRRYQQIQVVHLEVRFIVCDLSPTLMSGFAWGKFLVFRISLGRYLQSFSDQIIQIQVVHTSEVRRFFWSGRVQASDSQKLAYS